ncbi:hypothetical protein LSAT2_011320 [Lamellibrachia satsuma]|nr:hypothetical protein LSAT2_011320 [Lamellibrachia satsuma]
MSILFSHTVLCLTTSHTKDFRPRPTEPTQQVVIKIRHTIPVKTSAPNPRWNPGKADWLAFAATVEKNIHHISTNPDTIEQFELLLNNAARQRSGIANPTTDDGSQNNPSFGYDQPSDGPPPYVNAPTDNRRWILGKVPTTATSSIRPVLIPQRQPNDRRWIPIMIPATATTSPVMAHRRTSTVKYRTLLSRLYNKDNSLLSRLCTYNLHNRS